MIRAIIWFAYFWSYLFYTAFILIKVKALDKQNKLVQRDELTHETARKWAKAIVGFSGSSIKVIGQENIPKDGGVLFVANHQSNFDIPILIGFVTRPKGFIAKLELMKVPVFSSWMKYIGCIFIDRGDVRQSLKAIKEGAERLVEGHALVIFPEGTRSKDGIVGEFKPGSLKLAMKSKVPIIPVTIKGSMNMMPKDKFVVRPSKVEVIISPPIIIDEIYEKDSSKITEKVRNIIIDNLK